MQHDGDPTASFLYDTLDAAIAISGAQMGNVQLLDGHRLKIIAQRGFNGPFLKFFAEVENGQAACGEAQRRRTQVAIEDVTSHPIFMGTRALEEVLAADVRAVVSTPMVDSAGALRGMLSTHFVEPRLPTEQQRMLLGLLAQGAAQVIQHADASKKLQLKVRQLEKITEDVASPITQCSRDLRYVFVNKAYAKLIGQPAPEIMGRPIREIIGQAAFDTIRPHMERVLKGERVEYEAEIAFPGVGPRTMEVVYVPHTESDAICGWFAGMTDVTALRWEQRQKQELVSRLAHEMRQPLGAINNSVEMIVRAGHELKGSTPALEILHRQLKQLNRLVDGLLDVSAMDALGAPQAQPAKKRLLVLVSDLHPKSDDGPSPSRSEPV